MRERVITSPVRLTGSIHPEQLAGLVAVDALRRKRAALGEAVPDWELIALSGDVAVQRAVQRAVAREGDDRNELGREVFAERAKKHETDAAAALEELLGALNVEVDIRRWNSNGDEATRAARIAFVRLYEAGVLLRSEAVLDTCPSCQTVVDEADTDTVELEVEAIRLSLPLLEKSIELDLAQPELVVGAVAVAIPADDATEESYVYLPLLDAEVPIVAIDGLVRPVLVVPGHDSWSFDLAKQLNYPVIPVLDSDGVVRQAGALEGLTRFAARSAAAERLVVDGYVTATVQGHETVRRCYRCGTVLIPLLGRHWLLDFKQLVEPVIADVEAGVVSFGSPELASEFVDIARQAGTWSISQQLWTGHTIPVSNCLDCGATRVSVDDDTSCGVCMGTLSSNDDVLDARFVAAVTPLAMGGWPHEISDEEQHTTLAVGPSGLFTWALAMACVGKRLTDKLPFSRVVVTESNQEDDAGPRPLGELSSASQQLGAAGARARLAGGSLALPVSPSVERPADSTALAAAIEALSLADSVPLAQAEAPASVMRAAVLGQ